MVTRRKMLAAAGGSAMTLTAGCVSNPFLEAESLGCDHPGLHRGDSECTVKVTNRGPSRDVRVRYEVVDFDESVLEEDSTVVHLENGESKEVELSVYFPRNAAASGAFAEWA